MQKLNMDGPCEVHCQVVKLVSWIMTTNINRIVILLVWTRFEIKVGQIII